MGDDEQKDDKKGDDGDKEEDEDEEKTTSSLFSKVASFLSFDETELSKDVHLADDAKNLRKDINA
jgi:hypothetical protein